MVKRVKEKKERRGQKMKRRLGFQRKME